MYLCALSSYIALCNISYHVIHLNMSWFRFLLNISLLISAHDDIDTCSFIVVYWWYFILCISYIMSINFLSLTVIYGVWWSQTSTNYLIVGSCPTKFENKRLLSNHVEVYCKHIQTPLERFPQMGKTCFLSIMGEVGNHFLSLSFFVLMVYSQVRPTHL